MLKRGGTSLSINNVPQREHGVGLMLSVLQVIELCMFSLQYVFTSERLNATNMKLHYTLAAIKHLEAKAITLGFVVVIGYPGKDFFVHVPQVAN